MLYTSVFLFFYSSFITTIVGTFTTIVGNITPAVGHSKNCTLLPNFEVVWSDDTFNMRAINKKTPCVGKNKEFIYRECQDGRWDPEPECPKRQSYELLRCPENFTQSGDICYEFTKPSKFPPKCSFEDVISFSTVNKALVQEPVWLPVQRRNVSNGGLGLLQWVEPSSSYGTCYEGDLVIEDTAMGKDCVLYYNITFQKLTSCEEEHPGLCAYPTVDKLKGEWCNTKNNCRQSDFTSKSKCFCIDDNSTEPKAQFLQTYQNHVYGILTNRTCSLGLEKINGSYRWMNSGEELNYTYWALNVTFSDDHIYGAATPSGWILTEQPEPCVLVERDLKEVVVAEDVLPSSPGGRYKEVLELQLSFNATFTLSVSDPNKLKWIDSKPMIACFTDASTELIYKYNNTNLTYVNANSTRVEFMFEPLNTGPGSYWCEAMNSSNSAVINSNVAFWGDMRPDFVATVRAPISEHMHPLSVKASRYVLNLLNETLATNFTPRLMQIKQFEETSNTLLLNVHFTSLASQGVENDYFALNDSLKIFKPENLKTYNVEILELRSAFYCLREKSTLTWPSTEMGKKNNSEEYCFTASGDRGMRQCFGEFLNGSEWGPADECTVADYSPVTSILLSMHNIDDIIQILKENGSVFNPLDIYVISEVLATHPMDGDICWKVIDSLFDIDRKVLKESQQKMRATDRLLDIMLSYSGTQTIVTKNVILVPSNENLIGLWLSRNETGLYPHTLETYGKLDEVKFQENTEAVMWLSSELIGQATVFVIFPNDALFSSSKAIPKNLIFGVKFQREEMQASVEIVQKVEGAVANNTQCSSWIQDRNPDHWNNENHTDIVDPHHQHCRFVNPKTFFALTGTSESENLTDQLLNMLNSRCKEAQVMEQLVIITEHHDNFTPFDVFLVGDILQKFESEDVDLGSLVRVVSNLHNVERHVLKESQRSNKTTDTILQYVDETVKNHKNQASLMAQNFMVSIIDVKPSSFYGLIVTKKNGSLETNFLTRNVSLKELHRIPNLDSGVLLSSELRNQMGDDAKVGITLYSTDALFVEQSLRSGNVSRVFGVILPEIGTFAAPLYVFYKVNSSNQQEHCSHWFYNEETNVSSFWKRDHDGRNLYSMVICEFWHTTHFALLLLDNDKIRDPLDILDWVTKINCALSVVGLCCILLTATLFRRWRINTGNQILLNFTAVMLLQIAVFYVSSNLGQDGVFCTVTGVTLHYATISQFCWMFVIAILQFKRFVKVLEGPPKYVMFKACVCGWLLPLLPVMCVYLLDPDNYIDGTSGLCYPSGLGLYLGVWLPISFIITINFTIFLYIVYSVCERKVQYVEVASSDIILQWRLAVLLFFMLGLTWIFGFLADFGVLFVYLFCFMATLQGFVMFLFFVLFNANTRYMYSYAVKRCLERKNF